MATREEAHSTRGRANTLRLAMAGRPGIEIVGEAASGPETLDACSRLRPDVLVLDLVLPGLHGFEVVRRLRREEPKPAAKKESREC